MRRAETILNEWRGKLESRMMRKYPVRFGGGLDVHFISSLPVMQGSAYKASVDSKPVQMVWAED